jgi:hypothetical protein
LIKQKKEKKRKRKQEAFILVYGVEYFFFHSSIDVQTVLDFFFLLALLIYEISITETVKNKKFVEVQKDLKAGKKEESMFLKTSCACFVISNKYPFSSQMNNNIDILILSLLYQVTGCMTSDETGRENICVRTFFLYSSINSSYIDAKCTEHAFLSRLPIVYT